MVAGAPMSGAVEVTRCAQAGCGRGFGLTCWRHRCGWCAGVFCSEHLHEVPLTELRRRFDGADSGRVPAGVPVEGVCHGCDTRARTNVERWYKEGGFAHGRIVVFTCDEADAYRAERFRLESPGVDLPGLKAPHLLVPCDPLDFNVRLANADGNELKPATPDAPALAALQRSPRFDAAGFFRWNDGDVAARAALAADEGVRGRPAAFLSAFLKTHQEAWVRTGHEGSLGVPASSLVGGAVFGAIAAVGVAPVLRRTKLLGPAAAGAAASAAGLLVPLLVAGGVGALLAWLASRQSAFVGAWSQLCAAAQTGDRAGAHRALADAIRAAQQDVDAAERDRALGLVYLAEGYLGDLGMLEDVNPTESLRRSLRRWPENPWSSLLLARRTRDAGPLRDVVRSLPAGLDPVWARILDRAVGLLRPGAVRADLDTRYPRSAVRRVGEGAFKEVYEVRGDGGEALVVLRRACLGDPAARAAFDNEVAVLGRITARFGGVRAGALDQLIPKLIRHGHWSDEAGARPAYVTRLLQPGDLEARLARQPGGFPVVEALRHGQNLAETLAHLHAARIAHGDVKLANVGLTFQEPPLAVLCDYGAADTLPEGARTVPARQVTAHYAAPEIVKERQRGPAADVYALAVAVHRMLTGDYPPDDPWQVDLAATPLPGGVRIGLAVLLRTCLAPSPDARPTAEDVLRGLRQAEHLAVHSAPPPQTRMADVERTRDDEVRLLLESLEVEPPRPVREALERAATFRAFGRVAPGGGIRPVDAAQAWCDALRHAGLDRLARPWAASLRGWEREIVRADAALGRAREHGLLAQIGKFVEAPEGDLSLGAQGWLLGHGDAVDGSHSRGLFYAWLGTTPLGCRTPPNVGRDFSDFNTLRNALVHGRGHLYERQIERIARRWWLEGDVAADGELPVAEACLDALKRDAVPLLRWLYGDRPS